MIVDNPNFEINILLLDLINSIIEKNKTSAILVCESLLKELKDSKPLPNINSHTHIDDENVVHFWSYSFPQDVNE